MPKKLSPAEQLSHTTVRIECDVPGGKSTGTGFFYLLDRKDDHGVPVIVTNKHVVDGASTGRFLMTLQDAEGGPNVGTWKAFELDQFQDRWTPHPDSSVDLCVMPIASLVEEARASGTEFFHRWFEKSLIPSPEDVGEMVGVENVMMVGYPNGIWDSVNNLPIFRRGILATDYRINWKGKEEFLIDAACFPGSSGSPVILFDIGSFQTRSALNVGSRVNFLGVLYAVHQYSVTGIIDVVPVPTLQTPIAVTAIPNNLGVVIKAERLDTFEKLFT